MGWRNILKQHISRPRTARESGNAIAMVFMAIGMAGVVTYGLNNIMRGPAVTAAETGRRTIAENNLVATTRLAIAASARQGSNEGDCDGDGFVEPLPFRSPGPSIPAPVGGGLLPMTLGATTSDPWGAQYGYCVWDPGTVSKSDGMTECGGAGANRLEGAPRDDQPAIAVISAGKDGAFQTTCAAYVDTTPADNQPDAPMVVKAPNSDDIVLTYTYAEANGVGGGLWKLRSLDPMDTDNDIAEIGMNIESTSTGGATFSGKVELKNKGLVLPGDPGDDTVTGACDAGKDGQMRRNTASNPPTLEMCDFTNGGGWTQITGSAAPAVFNPKRGNCTAADNGPFVLLDQINPGTSPAGIWSKVGKSGSQTLFTANTNGNGVSAFSFDGSSITLLDHLPGGHGGGIDGYDDYFFVAGGIIHNIRAFHWDGTDITQVADINTVNHANDVYAEAGTIYSAEQDGMAVYDFDGSSITQVYKNNIGPNGNLWVDGSYVYAAGFTSNNVYEWDGAALNPLAYFGTYTHSVWGDANNLFLQRGDGGGRYIWALEWNGSALTTKATYTAYNGGIWSDGVHIFALAGSTLRAIGFDGLNFTLLGSIDLPTAINTIGPTSLWGDGNYLYVVLNSDGGAMGEIYALGGFGCNSPAVPGGYVAPKITPVSAAKKYVPEALDVGLVAHWKMDEMKDATVKDSVGTYDGTLLNDASHAVGQHGTGALHFNAATRDAVQINSLLGQPQKLTIAGWVNIGELDEDGTPDGAEIFHMGNNQVYLGYYRDLGLSFYYTGNDLEGTNTEFMLRSGWHYVVATLDTETEEMMRLYVDGTLYGESTAVDPILWNGGSNTYIGRSATGTGFDMTGSVDDFRVYNRALGAPEVAELTKKAQLEAVEAGPAPVSAPALSADNKISASSDYSCGIKKDGSMWCWGRDWGNQTLGNGPSRIHQAAPVQVTEPDYQVYYLTGTNSDITSWGGGSAQFQKTLSPYLQTAKASFTIADLAAPTETAYAFTPPGMPAQMPTTTENYKLVLNLSPANKAYCLQSYNYLQRVNSAGNPVAGLGFYLFGVWNNDGTGKSTITMPGIMNGTFNGTDRINMDFRFYAGAYQDPNCTGSQTFDIWGELHVPRIEHSTWTSVSTSSTHACGLKSDGSAWCWGMDSSDSLGNSGFASGLYDRPSRVVDTGTPWRQIATGTEHTCGIQANGTLWCWGGDVEGQLGNGAATGLKDQPQQVGSAADWASVTTGDNFTCAINSSGRAYCWGDDSYGQLGNGASPNTDQVSPYLLPDPGPWVKISAGKEHVCGIKSDSTAWCWGHSTARELGINSSSNLTAPVKISKPNGWIDISAGSFFTCAVNKDGNTYCWGEYNNSRLGNPAVTADNYYPTIVVGSQGSTSVTTGNDHACLTKFDGTVLCWGNDTYGQLGNGTGLRTAQSSPTTVEGFANTVSWTWNDASTIIMAPFNMNLGLNGNIFGSTATRGFGFTSPGRAYFVQDVDSNQLLLETTGTLRSTQLTFDTAAPSSMADLTTSLATKWMFNDATGTTAVGSVGGTNGTLAGTPVWNDKGRIGHSLVFDGVDDTMTVTNSATVRPAAFAIAAWIKPAAIQTEGAKIISKRNNALDNTYGLSLSATGGWLTLEYYTSDNTLWKVQSTVPLIPNAWNYVVAGYDRNGSAPRARIYINGKNATLTGLPTSSLALSYNTSTPAGDLFVGSDYTGSKKFKGEIDDLRLYSARLDDTAVMKLYTYQISQNSAPRSLGVNWMTNNLELHPNPTKAPIEQRSSSGFSPDFALDSTGKIGVGTYTPTARMDVAGSVRFGSEDMCDSNRTGAVRYTGGVPAWSYCNGTAWTGFDSFNQMGWKKDPNAITVGDGYACAIAQTGRLYCWGYGNYGRLGNNDPTFGSTTTITEVYGNRTDWKFVSGTNEHTCAIRTDGTLWCWGRNDEGQLGVTGINYFRPQQVVGEGGVGFLTNVVYVATGQYNTCAIRTTGKLYCWGEGWYGTNGDGANTTFSAAHEVGTDTADPGWSDWVSVSIGLTTTCGARANGTIWCWGSNDFRQVGNNSNVTATRPVRVHDTGGAASWTDWISVSSSGHHSCGRRANGQILCWGAGGNIGNNSNFGTTNGRPQVVHNEGAAPSWLDWKFVEAGFDNSCAIRTNGILYCWGDDTYGQLGYDYQGSARRPVHVWNDVSSTAWTDWLYVKMGVFTVCGIRADSTLWCFGFSDWGNGNGQNPWTQVRPVKVNSP